MIPDRDIIAAHQPYEPGCTGCSWHVHPLACDYTDFIPVHAAHVAAMLRANRTITSLDQLDALPAGTVVIDAENDTFKHFGGNHWHEPGNDVRWNADEFDLPAIILYHPDLDGGPS